MTLKEMKLKVLRMIEEVSTDDKLTDDPDIKAKLNDVINSVMFEVARMKKIPAILTENITDLEYDLKTIKDFYQLEYIKFKNNEGKEVEGLSSFGTVVEFPEEGTAKFYYYKYPERITDTTEETYVFELSDDALEVMAFGVAGDLLKSDVSNSYGQIYSQKYETMLQRLDPRYSMGMISFEGGIDI